MFDPFVTLTICSFPTPGCLNVSLLFNQACGGNHSNSDLHSINNKYTWTTKGFFHHNSQTRFLTVLEKPVFILNVECLFLFWMSKFWSRKSRFFSSLFNSESDVIICIVAERILSGLRVFSSNASCICRHLCKLKAFMGILLQRD